MLSLLLASLGGLNALSIGLWTSLLVVTATLLVLMRTNWGRARPAHRYVLLSVVAHLLLICLATTIRFRPAPAGDGPGPVQIRIVMQTPAPVPVDVPEPEIPPTLPEENSEAPQPVQELALPPVDLPTPENPPVEPLPAMEAPEPPVEPMADAAPPETPTELPSELLAPPLLPVPQTAEPSPAMVTPPPAVPQPSEPMTPLPPVPIDPVPSADFVSQAPLPLGPAAMADRTGEERLRKLQESGGDAHTEDAVAAALAWIAAAQSPDGRWDADRWAAGRERGTVLGHQRTGVGLQADTAMTGLSLLALLGAGHTHLEGPFADVIRDGLAYLVRTQARDGNLFGQASLFAQTYCHSMATFALAEAYALTHDPRLEPAVRRAVHFLVQRQDPRTGGWRYRAGDPGDMSQLGWILMALRSAEIAGIEIPPQTWDGIERFVRTTQRGQHHGLASYRPSSSPSHSMTAESLYCRQILGSPIPRQTSQEAVSAILSQPPGQGRPNLYAWYYATLALHHHRQASPIADQAWSDWNSALKQSLLADQVAEGVNKGSWSPNTVWGRCGGRVYSTALSTMCLEVYYRYNHAGLVRDPWIAARQPTSTLR